MDFVDFFKLLYRRKVTLIVVPLITVIAAYFLVKNIPDVYISHTRIATGLVDKTQQMPGAGSEDENKISQQFDNLKQMLLLKKVLGQVSYQLILHDLNSNTPYRKPSKQLSEMSAAEKQHAQEVFTHKYQTMDELSLWNKDEAGLYKLLRSMKYDDASISSKLTVYRISSSDYVMLEFGSENPQLSAVVLNTLCSEFINYYTSILKRNKNKAVNYLDSLLIQKQNAMNEKMVTLKEYKIQNRILNLNEQAKSLYGQIADFETRREVAEKDIIANAAAIKDIDSKFNPADRRYFESTMTSVNRDIVRTKEQLKNANQKYIASNYDARYKSEMDSLQSILSDQIQRSTDNYIYSPLSAKQNLVTQKLNLEVNRELSQNSVASLNGELDRLNRKLDKLVPSEAVIQSYENDIDVLSKEYLELLAKYNQANFDSGNTIQLRQVEKAMPGELQPGKKMLLVILSGIISFVFCLFVMFVLFFFDRSIHNAAQLANASELPVLGYLNRIEKDQLDLGALWRQQQADGSVQLFKELLRSIRFEIENEMLYNKVLAITSLQSGEGKTFLTVSLAYALAQTNKKVLIIDGNFQHPDITDTIKTNNYLNNYFKDSPIQDVAAADFPISILGNNDGDRSVLEISTRTNIDAKFAELKKNYDIILIETASLQSMSKAKEWFAFADKVVTVFEAGKTITNTSKEEIAYLKAMGGQFSGFVLNKVAKTSV